MYLSHKCMPISVRIPTEKMMIIAINWSVAKCSCPSWSTNADESALRSALASLDTCNSSLHWWLGFWTFLVAFGVVLELVFVIWEYLEELHDLKRCLIYPPLRPTTTLFVLGFFAAGLVAAGVSGELRKESQIAAVDACIRKGNDTLFFLLSKEAGDAEHSAEIAQENVDAIDKKSNEIADRLNKASTQLSILERVVRVQGPRWKTLEDNKAEFVKALKAFRTQPIAIVECASPPQESAVFEMALVNTLGIGTAGEGSKSAGWYISGTSTWNWCRAGAINPLGGNLVLYSSASTAHVKEAAEALNTELNKIDIYTIPWESDPKITPPTFFIGIGSPWEVSSKDPSLVVLLIGQNPMVDLSQFYHVPPRK
jgi:hypothetical protein